MDATKLKWSPTAPTAEGRFWFRGERRFHPLSGEPPRPIPQTVLQVVRGAYGLVVEDSGAGVNLYVGEWMPIPNPDEVSASDAEIATLRARVEAMGAAMVPLAEAGAVLEAGGFPDAYVVLRVGRDVRPITAGMLRACQPHALDRAAAVLAAARDPLVIKALEFWIFCAEHDTSGSITSLENHGRIPAVKALIETLRPLDAGKVPA